MPLRRTLLLLLCIAFFTTPLLSHAIESDPLGNCPGQDGTRTRLSVHIPGVSKKEQLTPGLTAQAIEALKAAATPGGIPGAVATAAARVNKVNSKYCYYVTGDLVDYIKGLYTFGLTVGGFLAVVMIMIGGAIWAGAGGNPELIKKGQQRVLNAIFGLVLLLASYTILNLINPDLVKLERINPDPTGGDITLKDTIASGRLNSQQIDDFVARVAEKKRLDPKSTAAKDAAMQDALKEIRMLNNAAILNYHEKGDAKVAQKHARRISAESQIVTNLYTEAVKDVAVAEKELQDAQKSTNTSPLDLKKKLDDAEARRKDLSKQRLEATKKLAEAEQFASCLEGRGLFGGVPDGCPKR